MGRIPSYMPTTVCFDCSIYFWLGLGLGLFLAVILVLAAHHVFK